MPTHLVSERFPVAVVENGRLAAFAYIPVRSSWNGADRQLFSPNGAIKRIVIVCHGGGSNADGYSGFGEVAAQEAGVAHETLIVAPQFAKWDDLDAGARAQLAIEPALQYWEASSRAFNGYEPAGDVSLERSVRTSSFEALDQLLAHVTGSGLFPDLETVVLTGHSGGGQLTLRYAISSRFDPPEGISLRYVPMNPGSVIYLSPKRPRPNGQGGLELVEPTEEMIDLAIELALERGIDPDKIDDPKNRHDNYRYGLAALEDVDYHAGLDRETLRQNFARRPVAYLIGALDDDPGGNIPKNARAQLQGPNRLERSRGFELHARDEGLWDDSIHVRREVPGVAHEGEETLRSPLGLHYVFGHPLPIEVPPPDVFDPRRALIAEAHRILREIERSVLVSPPAAAGRGDALDARARSAGNGARPAPSGEPTPRGKE